MSTHKIIRELLDENLIGAKKEIEDVLYIKLGEHLDEMYAEVAPELLGEAKKKHKKHKKGKKHNTGKKQNEDEKPDFLDADGDGDEDESWKDAEEDKKKKKSKIKEAIERAMSEQADTTPAGKSLQPGGMKDEPGDISTKTDKKAEKGASKAANSGIGAY